jgi:hypothetical protein
MQFLTGLLELVLGDIITVSIQDIENIERRSMSFGTRLQDLKDLVRK